MNHAQSFQIVIVYKRRLEDEALDWPSKLLQSKTSSLNHLYLFFF